MKVPGFTAEASLYKLGANYRMMAGGNASNFRVVQQALRSRRECYLQCGRIFGDCLNACGFNYPCYHRCNDRFSQCSSRCVIPIPG
jgi:hypothetical protein